MHDSPERLCARMASTALGFDLRICRRSRARRKPGARRVDFHSFKASQRDTVSSSENVGRTLVRPGRVWGQSKARAIFVNSLLQSTGVLIKLRPVDCREPQRGRKRYECLEKNSRCRRDNPVNEHSWKVAPSYTFAQTRRKKISLAKKNPVR